MSSSLDNEELRAFLDPVFNGQLVQSFAAGIYTLIFIQAVWKLSNKGNKRIYISALCISWICVMVDNYLGWASNRHGFVISDESPVDMAMGAEFGHNTRIAQVVVGWWLLTCSDGILIWRCHVMWHNKFMSTIFVLLLLTTDALMIWNGVNSEGHQALLVATVGTLTSSLSTISATFMIALKIILTTRQSRMQYSYKRIVNILVQSAFLVSIVNLAIFVAQIIEYAHPFQLNTASGKFGEAITIYISSVQASATGIAPTLIAFRVAEESSQRNVSTQIRSNPFSGLFFRKAAQGAAPRSSVSADADTLRE